MGSLIYGTIASLDGYIADENGDFGWAEPDAEVHSFINDEELEIGTYLYGRRTYETMAVWEDLEDDSPQMRDYAQLWRAAEKIVYSTTLPEVTTSKTRLERSFDVEAVRRLVSKLPHPASISGPGLARHALLAGLVDELRVYVVPMIIGGGTKALPDGLRLKLRLDIERHFDNGTVYMRYKVE
ncbi:dihydrofolate reductase family protein [Stackebrandtia soli]|uniref:dihydrofolate reductase family protein n=1 Tax=Stackebrandtia soli TaxID=1892856 RepID=UPI0039E85EFF